MQVQEVCYGCAHVCISHKSDTIPIFWKSDTFQTWCSCGWLSITPLFSLRFIEFRNLSITYSRLHSIDLKPFPPCCFQFHLLQKCWRSTTFTCFLYVFQVLIFFYKTKNWKDNRLLFNYLLPTFHLCRNQVTCLHFFSKDVACWSVCVYLKHYTWAIW